MFSAISLIAALTRSGNVVAPTDLIWLLFFTAVPLIATTLLLCAEANVVRTDHLYPRALLTPFTDNVELTRGDRKTYVGQAKAQRAKGFERHPFYRHHTAAPA